MNLGKIVSREEWRKARVELLAKEKELTRAKDALAAQRRALPRVKLEAKYVFDAPEGETRLVDLFGDKSQLIVYHFMFDPSWEQGCKSCSFIADHIDGMTAHLGARDIAFTAISRGPLAKLEAFKKRMGWRFRWVSSFENDFNYDFAVSFREADANEPNYNFGTTTFKNEAPGLSAFVREGDDVFHTYSTYGRGVEALMGTYEYINLTPRGRNEEEGEGMAWVRHHDKY